MHIVIAVILGICCAQYLVPFIMPFIMQNVIRTAEGNYRGFWVTFILSFVPIVQWVAIPLLVFGVFRWIIKVFIYLWNCKITIRF